MKSTMTFKSMALITLLGAALAAPVFAQGGPGMGGQGGGRGGMRFSQNNTVGWSLMTVEERNAHQLKMRSVKTYDECKQLQTSHREAMEVRAKEKGITLPTPRQNGCDRMKARGFIN